MFGLFTTSQVNKMKQELRDYYEMKLLEKDELISKCEHRFQISIGFQQEMEQEIKDLQNDVRELEDELEKKDRIIRSCGLILDRIDKERGRLFNAKSDRIKKKYAKKINEKIEELEKKYETKIYIKMEEK